MTSQTYTDRVKEARKKRWRYLAAKFAVVGMFLGAGMALIGLECGARKLQYTILDRLPNALTILIVGTILVFCTTVPLIICFFAALDVFARRLPTISYVPPVSDQIAALPAEETLLRGSDEPAAGPGELLRAAQSGTLQPSKDLLRPART